METVLVEEKPAEAVEPAACPDCGETIEERFCPRCGEKRVEARDYSLRHFLAEALNVFANVESPIPRSFLALVRRPGLLTSEYLAGRRKRYLKPLQLFVFCNVIFFFAQRRVYGQSRRLTTLKCVALVFAGAYVLQIYRFILFFTAYYTA